MYQLFTEYKKFKSDLKTEYMSRLDDMRKRMAETEREIANIVKVIAKTGSDALCNRLEELENEKLELRG